MLFTNSVGEIVHQSCHDNRGEPNKNIGDAFLIVWRPRTLGDHSKIVDGALTAFRRCVREIASSQTLQLVTNVEAIHKKFGRGKYRTKLGFGLHFGWSVEGPVGSPTKIDCSYLSPEVKISDRLEAACAHPRRGGRRGRFVLHERAAATSGRAPAAVARSARTREKLGRTYTTAPLEVL